MGIVAVATLCAVLVTRATQNSSVDTGASLRSSAAVQQTGAALGAGRFVFADGSSILVQPGSSVALLADDEEGTLLRVSRGQVLAHVESRLASRPFVVLADKVRVQVVGTLFEVAAHQEHGVRVRGYEGVVVVHDGEQERRLGAGEYWPADVLPLEEASEQLLQSLHGDAPTKAASLPSSAGALAAPSQVESRDHAATAGSEPAGLEPASTGSSEPAATENAAPSSKLAAAIPVPSFGDARTLERKDNLKAALRDYRAIALANGPQAEDALFAVGRILRTKMAKPNRALKSFDRYRKRYPAGRYAMAVDVHIIELLLKQERWSRIEDEASRFLAAHPSDARAVQFRIARALSRAVSGNCEGSAIDRRKIPPDRIPARLKEQCR
jgi:hypothetical protein